MRKFKEGVLACHLENHLTKKQILTTYLNERMQEFKIPEDIFFGSVTQNGDYLGEGWCEKGIVLAFKKGTEPKRLKNEDTLPFIFEKDFTPEK